MEDNNNDWISNLTGEYNRNNDKKKEDDELEKDISSRSDPDYYKNQYIYYQNRYITERGKSKTIKIISTAIICALLILFLISYIIVSCAPQTEDAAKEETARPQIEITEKETITSVYNRTLGYVTTVSGCLKNVSEDTIITVSITYACYDENGNHLGITETATNYLVAHKEWHFTTIAVSFPAETTTIKLVSLKSDNARKKT